MTNDTTAPNQVGSGHTPGPWGFEVQESGSVVVKDGHSIGAAFGSRLFAQSHLPHEANARLIAAAPDLLEALQSLFNSYKALADSGDAGNWRVEDWPEGKAALAAIAKATGATS